MTPAPGSTGGEVFSGISALPKCLFLLFVASKWLLGDMMLSCPLLRLLVLAPQHLFISSNNDHGLSVQSVLEFRVLPHARRDGVGRPGSVSSPSSSSLLVGWKNPKATCLHFLKEGR